MAKLTKTQLEEVLKRRLKLRAPKFVLEKIGSKLSGSIIDDKFIGSGDLERQRAIWDALEGEFKADAVQLVGTVLAYTNEEWDTPLQGNTKRRISKKAG
jgi:acid stress-induced BolA-like protein IbaG/YrbA